MSKFDEQKLAQELFELVRQAQQAYNRARAIAKERTDDARNIGLDHLDGAHEYYLAVRSERSALETYSQALMAYTDLVANRQKPTPQWFFESVLKMAINATAADKGTMQIFDPAACVLHIVAQRGFDLRFLNYFKAVSDDGCACGKALRTMQPVIVEDIIKSPVFPQPTLKVLLEAGVRAVQSMPVLSAAGFPLGIISTHYRQPTRPSPEVLALLGPLAQQVARLISG